MAFAEFVPAGAAGATVTLVSPLTAVTATGGGTNIYDSTAGCGRDNMGVRSQGPASTDSAFCALGATTAAAGRGRCYGRFNSFGSGTAQTEFFRLNSSVSRVLRIAVTPTGHGSLAAGVVSFINFAGTIIASSPALSLNTNYHFQIAAQPDAAGTAGKARIDIWNDDESSLWTYSNDAQNLGTTANIKEITAGKVSSGGGATGMDFEWTRLAFDNGATLPATFGTVAKQAVVTTASNVRVWVGDRWK